MTQSFDAVVIGAGHNSLAAALHLAAKGWRVGVFEQAPTPGGAVKTGEYTLPGFRHDWAAMNLSLFAGSPFFKAYGADLQANGLAFAPVADCFASVFPDGRWVGVSTDLEATVARIEAISPTDGATWRRLVAAFPQEAGLIFALLGNPMTIRALGYFIFKLIRAKGLSGGLDMVRFLVSSPRKWLEEEFEAPEVRATLAAWGMHLDFAPDIAGGAVFPYLEGMANQSFGMVLGQGGADTIIRAMVGAIEAKGGKVICNARVDRIILTNGKASGISLENGHNITSTRAVIANVSPGALARLTGATGDARYDAGMARFDHAPGTMTIHLALSDLPDWSASPDLKRFAYVHIAPSLDQMARTYAQAKAGMLPDAPVIVVGQPTAVDAGRAPEGRHVLWLQVRMAPGIIKGDAGGAIAVTDWAGAAEPFA